MADVLAARIGQFVTTVARHAVPIGGVFGRDWHPASAIAVYWVESVLLVLATAALCALFVRRTPPSDVERAGIDPGSVGNCPIERGWRRPSSRRAHTHPP